MQGFCLFLKKEQFVPSSAAWKHNRQITPPARSVWGGGGQTWLSLQMGKSNHIFAVRVKVWHTIKSIFWMVHHAQLATHKSQEKSKKALSRTNSTHATKWLSCRGGETNPKSWLQGSRPERSTRYQQKPSPKTEGVDILFASSKTKQSSRF